MYRPGGCAIMAKKIKHFVECPECKTVQMAVADKIVSSARVPMLFGHCKGCGFMLQGKAHQQYLSVPVDITVPDVQAEPLIEESEEFDPSEINHPAVMQKEEPAASAEQSRGGFGKLLMVLGFTAAACGLGGVALKMLAPR